LVSSSPATQIVGDIQLRKPSLGSISGAVKAAERGIRPANCLAACDIVRYNRHSPHNLFSNRLFPPADFDLLNRVQPAGPRTRTDVAGVPPIGGRRDGTVPKRPGTTLRRPRLVHQTAPGVWFQKNAIAVGVLFQTGPPADATCELVLEILDRQPELLGHRPSLGIVDPHEPRLATATPATLRALEPQPVPVPAVRCPGRVRLLGDGWTAGSNVSGRWGVIGRGNSFGSHRSGRRWRKQRRANDCYFIPPHCSASIDRAAM